MRHARSNPIIKHKLLTVFFVFACLLVLLRIALPSIIKTVANNFMAKDSPYFSFHIDDVDLYILKGQYEVKGISGLIKNNNERFLTISSVIAEVPWNILFKDQIISATVVTNGLTLAASQNLLDNAKLEGERIKQKLAEMNKDKKPEDPNKDPVARLNYFALSNSKVIIHDFMSFKGDAIRTISDINVLAMNLIPTKANPKSSFQMSANVFGPAPLNVIGSANLKNVPPSWDMNTELKNFDLPQVNPFLQEKVQAFIRKGNMDMYSEVMSDGNEVKGYVKPFVSKLKMDAPKGGFHFTGVAAKTGGNLVKILLTDSDAKTLATEVPFTFAMDTKEMKLEVLPVLQKAVVHKVKQNIKPGIDDNIGEKGLGVDDGLIQAQEAR